MSKKLGRPTEKPLVHDVKVRMDEEMYTRLTKWAKALNKTLAETVREAVDQTIPKD